MTVGERIKFKRKENDLTLIELANKLGVTEATVQRYESGNIKNLKQSTISKLAIILNTTPAFLMGWEEFEEKESKPLDKESEELADKFEKSGILVKFKDFFKLFFTLPKEQKKEVAEYAKFLDAREKMRLEEEKKKKSSKK